MAILIVQKQPGAKFLRLKHRRSVVDQQDLWKGSIPNRISSEMFSAKMFQLMHLRRPAETEVCWNFIPNLLGNFSLLDVETEDFKSFFL